MLTLHIDTTNIEETYVALKNETQTWEKRVVSRERRSQMVLPLIEELLREHTLKIHDITHISLATGPGSFTGLKVGASIAGMLSLLLTIPINGNAPGTIPELNYGKDVWGLTSS